MKSRKTIKKALAFLGVTAAATGAICATSIALNNTQNSHINNNVNNIINTQTKIKNNNIETIIDIDLINAIESYNSDPSISNVVDSYQFKTYQGESSPRKSIIRNVKSKIKYISNDLPNIVSELPSWAISISEEFMGTYNVTIDLHSLNGKVIYVNPNNNEIVEVTDKLSFNARWINSIVMTYESDYMNKNATIGYIAAGCIGTVLLLLLVVFIVKRKNADKYMY